jgi:hypothetical protein
MSDNKITSCDFDAAKMCVMCSFTLALHGIPSACCDPRRSLLAEDEANHQLIPEALGCLILFLSARFLCLH